MRLEERLARAFVTEQPTAAARALERLPLPQRATIVRELREDMAQTVTQMTPSSASDCLARLAPGEAAQVLARVPLDSVVLLLRRLPNALADHVVGELPREIQEGVRRVLKYPEGTAGALMDSMVMALPDDITVGEARRRLRRAVDGLLYYLFVVDRSGRLVGVMDIAELMRARARESIRTAMHDRVERLPAWTPAAAVRTHPGWRAFHAMPVTDEEGRLVGAIRYQTARRLEREADAGGDPGSTTITAGALGELFTIGVAGFLEGIVAAAGPPPLRLPATAAQERDR